MASLADFISAVRSEAKSLSRSPGAQDSVPLGEIFINSIQLSLSEIKNGADSYDFRDLAVANFLIASARENVPTENVANFVKSLGGSDGFKKSASLADAPVSDFSEGLPPLDSIIEVRGESPFTPLPDLVVPLPPLD